MKLSSPLIFAMLALAALSSCQTTSTAPVDRFARADSNGDGFLSREDISDFVVHDVFDSRDVNKDGILTYDEWWVEEDAEQRAEFNKRDANGDGLVTLAEALAYGRKSDAWNAIMKEADANGDGKISREEAEAYYAKREGPIR